MAKKEARVGAQMELLFRALADRTRLRLLNLLAAGEVCVCFFVEVLGESQPKISRHLAYLRRAGVVVARRDGKWMHYRVSTPEDPHAARVFAEVMTWLGEQQAMRKDRARMETICCATTLPVRLQGAPRPAAAHASPSS